MLFRQSQKFISFFVGTNQSLIFRPFYEFSRQVGKNLPMSAAEEPKRPSLPDEEGAGTVEAIKKQVPSNFESSHPEGSQTDTNKVVTISKYLRDLKICTRGEAEKFLKQGMIKLNKKKIRDDVVIDPSVDKIELSSKNAYKTPLSGDARMWVIFKPKGCVTVERDEFGRPTIHDLARSQNINFPRLYVLGSLDFNSEGLMFLTNNVNVARSVENQSRPLEQVYRVRVFGLFDDRVLEKCKEGMTINGKRYGPYRVEIEKRQTRNTWLMFGMEGGSMREIRRVMQKFSLRVNRVIRVQYGTFKVGKLQPGEIHEIDIPPMVKKQYYLYMKEKSDRVLLIENEKKQIMRVESGQQEKEQLPGDDTRKAKEIETRKSARRSTFSFRKLGSKGDSRPQLTKRKPTP